MYKALCACNALTKHFLHFHNCIKQFLTGLDGVNVKQFFDARCLSNIYKLRKLFSTRKKQNKKTRQLWLFFIFDKFYFTMWCFISQFGLYHCGLQLFLAVKTFSHNWDFISHNCDFVCSIWDFIFHHATYLPLQRYITIWPFFLIIVSIFLIIESYIWLCELTFATLSQFKLYLLFSTISQFGLHLL